MSHKLPRDVSGDEAISIFHKIGYRIVRTRGSHVRLRDDENQDHKPITIPKHGSLKPGLLSKLIHDASLDVETFIRLRTQ